MSAFLLVCLLAAPAAAAPASVDEEQKLVDYFLKTPTSDLNPQLINRFMALDMERVPEAKRPGVSAKRLELNALRKSMESKTKPPIRRAGLEPPKSCDAEEGDEKLPQTMKSVGFEPITEDESHMLQGKTKCSECELVLEFTMTRVIVKADPKKKKPAMKHLFLHGKDPLMALVSQYRQGSKGGTNFFGAGFFGACR
ncbi:MAG: hypothetical protein HYZ75_05500 [Elusimicrobia bacterium]|nr:hypothetical protein [Elusimicrobiota bacterium]